VSRTAYIILGKAGDIFSCLPIIQSDHDSSVIVSEKYSSVLNGVCGINPLVYPGEWEDVAGAIRWAKTRFTKVIPIQTYDRSLAIQHRCPNFQHDQFLRAGRLDDWDALPLVLPRNMEIKSPESPFILVADESESSPFKHRQELVDLLTAKFSSTHKIVLASGYNFENIKDFIPIYDSASLIVSVDTAHIHLSLASKTPIAVFSSDIRVRWQGTPHSRRFVFYCRYSQYEERKDEFVRACEDVISKVKKPSLEFVKTEHSNGYNMGLMAYNGRTLLPYRYHPENGKWRTKLAMKDGDKTLPIIFPDELKDHSIEDGKPFLFNRKPCLSYVISTYPSNPIQCVVGYGALIEEADCWRIAGHIQPNYGNNNFSGTQKNWVLFERDTKLYAIHGSNPTQLVLHLNGASVVGEMRCEAPKWGYGEIRGGTVLPYGDNLIRFFHSLTGDRNDPYNFRYHIGALLMESKAPFKTIKVSSRPIISGNEIWTPNCSHYKPNVVFPCGALHDDSGFTVALGINDSRSALLKLKEGDLNL
jgi:hypothetical protein